MATDRDKTVLSLILNPLLPSEPVPVRLDDEAVMGVEDEDEGCEDSLRKTLPNYDECLRHELAGVKAAEEERFDDALSELNTAVALCAANPSPYNNRAQVFRLLRRDVKALEDLNKAIELSSSSHNGTAGKKVLCQAHIQRAMIHQLRGDEEPARADYEHAAALGSTFAKSQLVAMNPYAAMCNQMLGEVMSKLQPPPPPQ